MAEKKVTKAEMYAVIKELVVGAELEDEITAFCDKELETLAKRAAKAAERRAEKKAEADELQAVVESILTDKYQTIAQILDQIKGDDLTPGKISARMKKLIEAGVAEKDQIKVEGDSKKKVAYRLVQADAE